MDTKSFFNKCKRVLKENVVITSVIGIMWLVLGWLKSYGVNSILLFPFNFISGALNGVDGGSVIGGIFGKTLILMTLNSLLRPMMFSSGNKQGRMAKGLKSFRESSISKIPHYKNINQFFTKENKKRSYNELGFGLAFLAYPFITGNGSFQNSGVCVLLAITLFKEMKKQRSLILIIVNSILMKKNKKVINKDNLNRIISGNALGFACTVVFSIISGYDVLSYSLGSIVIAIGFAEMYYAKKMIVEVAK